MTSQLPPRASLVSLPQELQDVIVLHLTTDPYRKNKALLSLSYTCKILRATCLPLIYEAIDVFAYQKKSVKGSFYRPDLLLARSVTSPYSVDVGQYIKRIRLSGLKPSDRVVEQILSRSRNLTRLHCVFSFYQDADEREPYIDMQRLGDALRCVSGTLTELSIINRLYLEGNHNVQPTHTASDLKHLTVLKVLKMPVSLLLGWRVEESPRLEDVLPHSLIHLALDQEDFWRDAYQWAPEKVTNVLKGFVENEAWRKITPGLETITVHDHAWGRNVAVHRSSNEKMIHVLKEVGLQYFSTLATFERSF